MHKRNTGTNWAGKLFRDQPDVILHFALRQQVFGGVRQAWAGSWRFSLLLLSVLLLLTAMLQPVYADAAGSSALSGRVIDKQGLPVQGATIALYLDASSKAAAHTQSDVEGLYLLDLPGGPVQTARLEIAHPHFQSASWQATEVDLELLSLGASVRVPNVVLARQLTAGFWIATLVFGAVLTLIITERLHATAAALLGAAVVLAVSLVGGATGDELFIIDFEQAIHYIDFDVIFLVLGMMIIVGTIERTGIFQWAAYQAYRLAIGQLWLLVLILMLLTSVASALLDNVTTMLLVAPITLQISLALGMNPLSLLIPEILASNVGGISTLIGTPNNILIGSYAGLGFNDFLRNLTPGVVMVQLALTLFVLGVFRKSYGRGDGTDSQDLLDHLRENARITEPELLRRAGAVFVGTLVLFVVGESIHLVPAVTAMIGAATTLLVVQADVDEILRVVDWSTLLFFIALFMLVGAIQEVGLISLIATGIHQLVGENLLAATLVTIWGTAMLCLLIPTIPLTAALLPVVGFLSQTIPGAGSNVLFYSLSMGSALGANNSLVGATNNMVAAGISRQAGYPISYRAFLRVGFPAAVITLIVGTLWILIRF